MKKVDNLEGKIFGELSVLSISNKRDNQGKILWNCKCSCGKQIFVRTYSLKNGTKSCGCKSKFPRVSDMALNQKYATYKTVALKKGLDFTLTKNEFFEIIKDDCNYCGGKPKVWSPYIDTNGNIFDRYKGKVDEQYMQSTSVFVNGIDRIDSSKGYIKSNVVACCSKCNIMKNVYSEKEFLNHVEQINRFQNNKKI